MQKMTLMSHVLRRAMSARCARIARQAGGPRSVVAVHGVPPAATAGATGQPFPLGALCLGVLVVSP